MVLLQDDVRDQLFLLFIFKCGDDGVVDGGMLPECCLDFPEFDPEAANAILDRFGYMRGADGYRRNPDGSPLVVSSLTGTSSDARRGAEFTKRMLDRIGVVLRSAQSFVGFAPNQRPAPRIFDAEQRRTASPLRPAKAATAIEVGLNLMKALLSERAWPKALSRSASGAARFEPRHGRRRR